MEWLKITGPAFKKYVASGNAVAVLPTGSIEKHGEHLPTGTDGYQALECCRRAARIEPAAILPTIFYNVNDQMQE